MIDKPAFFETLIHERFSVLEYERRDVAPELVRTILEAGIAAPTVCNFQPQRIKVIDDDASRAALGRVVPSRYYGSWVTRQREHIPKRGTRPPKAPMKS